MGWRLPLFENYPLTRDEHMVVFEMAGFVRAISLAALGAVASFDLAKRLLPDSRSAQLLALLLYGSSARVLITAMRNYAMTISGRISSG